MKRLTKSYFTHQLDKEISRIVRTKGYCIKCGKIDNLQTAHIISRSNRTVRWDLKNVLCLCAGDHINFAHKNPLLYAEFIKEYLGDDEYEQLKIRATKIKKWTIPEMQSLLNKFRKM